MSRGLQRRRIPAGARAVRWAVALALPALAAALPAPAAAQGTTAVVVVDGVERGVPLLERQGRRFVALEELARLLGGSVSSGAEQGILDVDDQRLVVHRRVPFVEVGGRWYQMTDPAQKDEVGFFLPASALDLLLPVLWPGRFGGTVPGATPPVERPTPVEPPTERPRERDRSGMIGAVDFQTRPGRTRLAFRTERMPGVEVDATEPRTLRLRLSGASLSPELAGGLVRVGLVDSARVVPRDGGSEITLWLDPAAGVFAVSPLRPGPRGEAPGLEVVLVDAPAEGAVPLLASDVGLRGYRAPGSSAGAEAAAARERYATADLGTGAAATGAGSAEPPAYRPRPDGRDWIVVLDAGHGGHDPGARGPGGTREKDVTLAVTLALRDVLQARPGIRVLLTRDGDTFVPLGERTRMANEARADLFVSIHANSAERSAAEGFETYFLSAAVTEDARRVARMENSALRYENSAIDPTSLDDVNFILWDLAQNEYLRESSSLAEAVQVELERRLPLKSRGVKQAPFYVLKGAFMPAILFETAFISNPREEELLDDASFQDRLADGLATSLLGFLDRYERKTGGATAAR